MSSVGVHQGHCCKQHGCKYGDADCPVELGQAEQAYACEECRDSKEVAQKLEYLLNELKWAKELEARGLRPKEALRLSDDAISILRQEFFPSPTA